MPRSGCSALHGVNPNLKKKFKKKKNAEVEIFMVAKGIAVNTKLLDMTLKRQQQ